MEIARPFLLFLLLLLPALYYGYRRSLVDLTRTQRIVSLIMRGIIIVLLVLSVADLQYLKTDDELAVIFLADISDSISADGLVDVDELYQQGARITTPRGSKGVSSDSRTGQRFSRICAATPKTSWTLPTSSSRGWIRMRRRETPRTLPERSRWRGVFFPQMQISGLSSSLTASRRRGDAIHAGLRGRDFGIQIDTVPLYPSDEPEVMLERIDAPVQVKQGEPFTVEVLVHSNHEDIAEIRLYKNKFEAGNARGSLDCGRKSGAVHADIDGERHVNF